MAITNTIYAVKVTSANTFISLVPTSSDFIMASLIVANTSEIEAIIEVRLADGNGTELSTIIVGEPLAAGESKSLDMNSLNVPAESYQLMIRSTIIGVHFTASGGVKLPNV